MELTARRRNHRGTTARYSGTGQLRPVLGQGPGRIAAAVAVVAVLGAAAAGPASASKSGAGKAGGGGSGNTSTTLTQQPDGGGADCSPLNLGNQSSYAWSATPNCLATISNAGGGDFATLVQLGSPSYELTPAGFPLEARAAARVAQKATHKLMKPANSVTYVWTLSADYYETQWVNVGKSLLRTGFTVSAHHSACSCTASVRRVLLGSDAEDGPGTLRQHGSGHSTFQVSVTLRNPSGEPLPSGDIYVRGELEGLAAFKPDPEKLRWIGKSYHRMNVWSPSLTATTG